MCGIAGLMTADGSPPPAPVLERMQDALAHRGPDGAGRYVEGGVGLVQTRLAIIDLETGDQPLYAEDAEGRRLALVANGEIYNYVEQRHKLGERRFRTRSDSETALQLYLDHGVSFARRLRGMYAVAIHDPRRNRLVLARDPFGIKPLYYAETEQGFAFASEPQALLRAGVVQPVLNPLSRDELLQLQFTCGRPTPYMGIQRVLPGETVVVENAVVVRTTRDTPLPVEAPRHQTVGEALAELDDTLNDTVGVHQRADVPYGMFLSGGIDSSVLLAMMERLNERPVQAFTAGFPGTAAHDEREHARAVARAAGAEHHEVTFGEADFWSSLPAVAGALDDPTADYAVLPTFKLAAEARAAGLKVVLSGEGGDEMFGGYGRYRRALRWKMFGGRPGWSRGILENLGVLRVDDRVWRRAIDRAEAATDQAARSPLQAVQAVDVAEWLPGDLLTKLDRCLMAHGVEGRVPFLDPVMADFAFRLPDRLKLRRGQGKWLLRRWLQTGLPASQPFARKKGFTVPVGAWMAPQAARLAPLVAGQPGIAEACEPGRVETLFRNLKGDGGRLDKAAWTLLFYALWHQRHLLGIAGGGDVFETLGEGAEGG